MSNRLMKVFEETNRDWNNEKLDSDEFLATDGRVMDSMLSDQSRTADNWYPVADKDVPHLPSYLQYDLKIPGPDG